MPPTEEIRWREWPTSDRLTAKGRLVSWLALTPKGDIGLVHICAGGNLGQTVLPVPTDRHDPHARGWRFLRVDLEIIRGRGLELDLASVEIEAQKRNLRAAEDRIEVLEQQLAELRQRQPGGGQHGA